MSQFIRNGAATATDATRAGLLLLTLCAATVGPATAARAELIQIPAITFVGRSDVDTVGDAMFGTLTNAKGTFFAAVPFPASGARVCRLILVHRDNDADSGIGIRLLRKWIILGDNPFTPPDEMASVVTTVAGAAAGVRKTKTSAIATPVINLQNSFYYVELTLTSTLLEVLGVQIEVEPQC